MNPRNVLYYRADADAADGYVVTAAVIVERQSDADVATVRVFSRDAAMFDQTLLAAQRCDPATPTAGHWSEILA